MRSIEKLREEITEAITEGVPLNTICPNCESDIDAECLINKDRSAYTEWKDLTNSIIKKVVNKLPEIMEEIR